MRNIFALLAVLALMGFVGCGGGGDGGTLIDTSVVGTWQPYFATVNGTEVGPAQTFEWGEEMTGMTLALAASGTVTVTDLGEGGTNLGSETGTWTASGGNATITMPDDTIEMTYQVSGNILTTQFEEEGDQILVRWVKVVNLAGHDAALCRSWLVTSVTADGAAVDLVDFFDPDEPATTFVVQLLDNGQLVIWGLDGEEVVHRELGTWATGGGAIQIVIDGETIRGAYQTGNTSLSIIDPGGVSATLQLQPWAPAGDHDSALVAEWQAQSVSVNGSPVSLADFYEWDPQSTSMRVYFFADGTFVNVERNAADVVTWAGLGTWNTDNAQLTVNMDGPMVMDYAISGSTATMHADNEGDDVTLVFQRIGPVTGL